MKKLVATGALLVASTAHAQHVDTPFIRNNYIHTFMGGGGSPKITTAFLVTTFEIGRHPFRAREENSPKAITFGAFSGGGSVSVGEDPSGKLFYASLGLRFAVDLTYVFLSGLWSTVDFDQCFPFHFTLGERLGVAGTESFGVSPSYVLLRVEAQTALDLEIPFGSRRQHSLLFRAAVDSSVALDSTFRWIAQFGYAFAWGEP